MPLSSVVGAQSIVRPGVCTSSTRPASPYDGQVIYETDTDKTLVWNGSGWVFLSTSRANPGGLDFITGASFTTVTSFSLPTNTFTSTYRNYRLIIDLTAVSADSTFTGRMRANGADDTSAKYDSAFSGVDTGAVSKSVVASVLTSFNLGQSDTICRSAYILDFIGPQTSTVTKMIGQFQFVDTTASYQAIVSGGGAFSLTTQFDSFSFISSVASSISGSYRVYGYAES